MQTELLVNGSTDPAMRYVGWAPSPCSVRLTVTDGVTTPVEVVLKNRSPLSGGQLLFRDSKTLAWRHKLALVLPPDGTPVEIAIAGEFGRPSIADGDAIVDVLPAAGGAPLSSTPLMVRIRKDATTLTDDERGRFVWAVARLNNAGAGLFRDFRCIHTSESQDEAHHFEGFLAWHRAYLVDFERELQNIDASVTLPYWRFDRPAPSLFTETFLGRSLADRRVQFAPRNPLQFWSTDGTTGLTRHALFDFMTTTPPHLLSEWQTLHQGASGLFSAFREIERRPHKTIHVLFTTDLGNLHKAVRDPLFFLLHANVDRLWAKWQRLHKRYDESDPQSYPSTSTRIGHSPGDTMWPWNQVMTYPRPKVAPGGTLASSPTTSAPGQSPRVGQMLDYQGVLDPSCRLGFDYDDVPC